MSTGSRIAAASLLAALAAGLVVACLPEPPARPLTPPDGWELRGGGGRIGFGELAPHLRHLRRSAAESPGAFLYRSWTPDAGVREVSAVSPPFRAPAHLAIPITGATRSVTGRNAAYLTCSTHARTLPIFTGSVNINLAEALVDVPRGWCDGETRAVLVAGDPGENVGIGTVFAVSALSAWKASFVGLLPVLAVSLAVIGAFSVLGAAAGARLAPGAAAPVTAAVAVGLAMLGAFLVASAFRGVAGAVPLSALAAAAALAWVAGRARTAAAARELAPYAKAWGAAALAYFALLAAARNGLGHWEPHYRFWPASWSSDAEFPWMFAEALRARADLGSLLGAWRITDRPPLLAGGDLLVADLLDLLQRGNDGRHLRGLAYAVAAIPFNALWVPAVLFLLVSALRQPLARARLAVAAVAVLPFSIFNTIYGWPKALGAAFAALAAALALRIVRDEPRAPRGLAALFGTLCGLSLLAHGSGALFLLPVGAWLVARSLARRPAALAAGVLPGVALLASWAIYQHVVLPSDGPLTKYALTGDFGIGVPKGTWQLVVERYRSLTLATWLDVKARMLLQPLLPLEPPLAHVHATGHAATDLIGTLNRDHGADLVGRLRAWDFDLLSAGNAAALLAPLGVALWRPRARAGAATVDAGAARTLVAFAGASWLVLALVFLAPIVLHHWPYAAVFVAAAAGFAWLAEAAPAAFAVLGGATALYVSVVWLVGPLRAARDVDPVALLAFLGVAGVVGASLRGSRAPAPLGLAGAPDAGRAGDPPRRH